MRIKIFFTIVFFLFFSLFWQDVLATGWWGDDVKSDNWILKHGGSLIRFEIINKQGDAREYKAVLTRSGKNIEIELGKQGLFDEARSDRYKVTFYRGGDGKKFFKNLGSEIASKSFETHSGESIKLKLNYKTKKISFETDYIKSEKEKNVLTKALPKKVPVQFPENNLSEDLKKTQKVELKEGQKTDFEKDRKDIVLEEDLCFSGIFRLAVCQEYPLLKKASPVQYDAKSIVVPEEKYYNEEKARWFDDLNKRIINFLENISILISE
jgi:hypothetical protein